MLVLHIRERGRQVLYTRFWVFPEFRGGGRGHRCFEALRSRTESDGARYYALNSGKENSVRFWRSIGFVDNGIDEYGEKLFIKR